MKISTDGKGGIGSYLLCIQPMMPFCTTFLVVLSTDLEIESKETITNKQMRLFTESQQAMPGYQARKKHEDAYCSRQLRFLAKEKHAIEVHTSPISVQEAYRRQLTLRIYMFLYILQPTSSS